ncbi:MAG: T9SS type A sorting domain-containing protein [Bacteroidota bacterium]
MKKSLLTLAIATVSSIGAFAQGYYFLKTKGTVAPYTMNPTTATAVITGTSTAQTGVLSATQTFPFTNWNFYGQPVTGFKVSSSGYLTFNTSMMADESNNIALPSATAPRAAIFAFWDNLRIQSLVQSGNTFPSDVRTFTYGTAPNQVFVVQWRLVQTNDATNATNVTYFAIRFYEAGNFDIVHNYGFGNFAATTGVQDLLGTDGTMVSGSPTMNFGGAAGSYDATASTVYSFKYGTQPAYDLKLTNVDIEKFLSAGSNTNVGFGFINNGGATVTSFRVNYSVDGGAAVSQNVTGVSVLGSGVGTYAFSHSTPYNATTAGKKTFKVWVDNINGTNADLNHSDDTLTKVATVVSSTVKRKSLQETFTSSTCPPCLPGNKALQAVLQQRMGGFTVIKYQYSFPGTGDPYFTLEGQSRGTYYGGINSVPRLQVDGKWNNNPNSYDVNLFDGFYAKPSVVSITANQTIVGNTITINAKVKPVSSLPGNYKIHFAVLEKTTSRNVKSNNETEFNWVMKKMLPDANGSDISFSSDAEQSISKTYTFPGGFRLPTSAVTGSGGYNGINLATENTVEEMNDLIGVIFVQDESDKEVLQSEWSGNMEWDYYAGTKETEVGATGVTIYPNPAQTTFTINAANVEGLASVRIVDITGKEVMTANAKGGMETALDVSALYNGIYFVHITVNGTTAVQKLTISK